MNTDTDQEIKTKLQALTSKDWLELEDLYKRVVDHKGSFSKMGGGQELEDGAIAMPYTIEAPIVCELRKYLLDKHLIVMFDWSHWSEGKALFKVADNDRFTDINPEDVIKLFIAVMRNDRFCDGAWADLFENGDAQRLLKRLLQFKPTNP